MTTTNNPTPNTDADTTPSALTLWTEQIAALADPAQADAAINDIYTGLMDVHAQLTSAGHPEMAEKAAQAYNIALALYESHQQHGVVIAGGAAAITEVEAQRQQAVGELENLLKAINEGDESHPKLMTWAENIRQDEYENSMYESSEGDYDYYGEIFDDNVRENINEAWDVQGDQGNHIYHALIGEFKLKKDHRQMLQRLISEMPTDYAAYQAYNKAVLEEPDEVSDDDE